MYVDDIKLFSKNEKEMENSHTHSWNIQSGHRDGIWHRKMGHAHHGKWQTTYDWRNGTTKSRQRNKLNQQILGDLGGWHHQTSANERHDPKRISQEKEKTTRGKTLHRNLIKGINTWAVPLVRYCGPFLKWTREELLKKWTKEQEN